MALESSPTSMRLHTIIDSLPRVLFRTFADSDLEYAKAFATEGVLRTGEIETYHSVGGDRQDVDESKSFALVPGLVQRVTVSVPDMDVLDVTESVGHFNHQASFRNPTYILCLSTPEADVGEMRKRFGRWSVAIRQPEVFIERIADAFTKFTPLGFYPRFLEAFPIHYNRGNVLTEAQLDEIGLRLRYGQKGSEFSCEAEYRLAAVYGGVRDELPKHGMLEAVIPAGMCEIIDLHELRALPAF